MINVYFSSDWHLGHTGVVKFRQQFNSPEEHDELIKHNILTTVKPKDILYVLGDAAFTKEALAWVATIPCRTILVPGNHDLSYGITMQDLVNAYDEVIPYMTYKGYWLSHIPIHPDELRNRTGNIHGHTHAHNIDDPRYINVSLEQTEFKPILFSTIKG